GWSLPVHGGCPESGGPPSTGSRPAQPYYRWPGERRYGRSPGVFCASVRRGLVGVILPAAVAGSPEPSRSGCGLARVLQQRLQNVAENVGERRKGLKVAQPRGW